MAEIVVNFLMDKLTTIEEEVQQLMWVKEEAVWIKDKLEHINALLIAADETEDRSPGLDVWIKQLRDVAYDIEDAIDEFRLLTHHPDHESHDFLTRKLSTIKKFIARHQMAAEIQRINSRIQSISDGHERFQSKTIDAKISAKTWDDHRQNALLIEEADLVGIENPKKQLVNWLIRDDTGREVVSVVGMGGLGKTTLVKEVYDDAQVKLQFRFRAWITVSQYFKMEELLKHMLQQLYRVKSRAVPQELDSMTNDQLRTVINSFLQHKRYLIVLDDLWHIDEWDAVKYALPSSNSSRVMLTTRHSDIASASVKEFHGNIYSLNPLPLEESRTLFCRKTFGENSCPPYLNNLTESILKRCEGLPLAIVAISGVLATKDRVDEWDMIKRSLADELKENPRLISMEKILLLSYKDLPYYLKSCFLYFSIFPENHVIDQMRLIRLWIAEGFVRTKDNMTLEEVAQGYLNELLNRSLIQVAGTTSEGRIKTWRVHDLLREIIISKVREHNFVTIARGQNTEWPEKVRRLSIHKTMPDVLQSQSISHLRSLHIFWRVDSLSESLKSLSFPLEFKLLNVLDLQGAPLEVFPNEIINMFLLKYLSLRSTMIKIIPPAIGNLRYLETLDLKQTCITALPVEILKLQKLRHLLVYRYEIQSYAQINSRYGFKAMAQIGCLHSLQKLCHIDADHGSNVILRELGKLDQLRRLGIVRFRREHGITLCTSIEMLKRLRSLSITSIEENEVLDLESLSCPPPFLQRLYLSGRLEKLPHWMSSLHSLAKISLKWSQLRDDPLEFLEDLPNLVHLEFLQVYEGETLHFNAGGFQRLKVLSLDKMDGLKMVIVEKGAMSSLEKLILQRCKLLHSLPSGIEHLRKLKSLEFCDMPNELIMTLRPDIDGGDYWKVEHVPEINTDASGEASVSSSGNQSQPLKPTNLDVEVVALSPKTQLATNEFVCEICKKGFKREPNLQLHWRGHNLSWKPSQGSVSTVDSSPPMPAPAQAEARLAPPQSTGVISLVLPIKSPEETSENEIASEHHGMEIDIEEVKMTDSSEQKKFEIEEMGNDASQTRQPDVIRVEDMQLQASSTLKPQRVLFDINAVNILKSSGLIQSQIEDVEMKSEASEQRGFFLMQSGLGLTMPPKDEDWKNAKEIYLMDNELSILPENPRSPNLSALFLPRNYKLRMIPPSFFDHMPALQILNLSRTSIKSLPDSIIKLVSLKRLFLNNCHRLMTLSPKVGDLKQLEVIDVEGAKIMDLPVEIKELTNLKCLEVSFYGYISNGKKVMQSNAVVPCGVISALSLLEELNIDVNPDDERWDARVEDIVTEVCTLKRLETLKFYFPRVELLRHFQWNSLKLSHFRFTVGRHAKRVMSRVPCDVEFELERWEKCLKYINGVGVPGDIKKVLQHAVAFFLDRHATVKKLSDFGLRNMEQLKCCVMGECNEVQVIVDEADADKEDDTSKIVSDSYGAERIVLGSLEYLHIYYMKNLRSIWEGSVQKNSLFPLKSLTLRTCPQLTTIFTQELLDNLCNLEELKVEDCPSIKSIVSCEISAEPKTSYFLPNLKKISLHYMPGLVSISSGLYIAPKLEWLSFYNCPDLKNPLIDEISCQDLKKIKGERSWWEALEWSNSCPSYLEEIFVPIDIRDC